MDQQDLILFLIGGTGARFYRSLIFQLAAGLKLKDIGKIKVVFIDSDLGNKNLEVSKTLMLWYTEIKAQLDADNNYEGKLFRHSLEYFDPSMEVLTPLDKDISSLSKIINYDDFDDSNRALVDLLLTDDELNANLSIGFEGRPVMGTIGLQRLDLRVQKSSSLSKLLGETPDPQGILTSKARLFMVSSMFGGMGSSGMPLLVQKFSGTAFSGYKIGSLSFMPYFKITNGEGTTDSKLFIPRTKIALEYYLKEFENKVDAIYFAGDDIAKSEGESHAKGGPRQNNHAHYVEFYAVSALEHFCDNADKPSRKMRKLFLTIDDAHKANATSYISQHKKYQLLCFIAAYYNNHFIKNYTTNQMKGLSWLGKLNLASFRSQHLELLQQFFENLLAYNETELNGHAHMNIIDTKMIPQSPGAAIPVPKYTPKTTFLGKEIHYTKWERFDADVIKDTDVKSTNHVARLLQVFEKSFDAYLTSTFK